jgi:hypothetical protein
MTFILSSYFIEGLGNEDVDKTKNKKNWEGLEKVGKTFF